MLRVEKSSRSRRASATWTAVNKDAGFSVGITRFFEIDVVAIASIQPAVMKGF
jgi:hypothetical protein